MTETSLSVGEFDALIKLLAYVGADRKNCHVFIDEIRTIGEMLEMDADQFHSVTGCDLFDKEPDENDNYFDYAVPMGAKDYGSDFDFCKAVEITRGFHD